VIANSSFSTAKNAPVAGSAKSHVRSPRKTAPITTTLTLRFLVEGCFCAVSPVSPNPRRPAVFQELRIAVKINEYGEAFSTG